MIRGSRAGSTVAATRVGSRAVTVTRAAARRLPVAGIFISAADAGAGIAQGDRDRVIVGAAGAAGGALMLVPFPPVQVVGAVVVVGSVVYEHREAIGRRARAVGSTVSDVVGGAASFVRGLF